MSKAKEDLKAILDLSREWCLEHGYDYLDLCVLNGRGVASTWMEDANPIHIFEDYKENPRNAFPETCR